MASTTNQVLETLGEMQDKGLFEGKRVVFFGANKSSKQMKEYLSQQGYNTAAVIDNDKRKQGGTVFGLKTYSPEEYLSDYKEDVIILIISQYYREMLAQLAEMGYAADRQAFVVMKMFRKYDTSEDAWEHFEKQIRVGQQIYMAIMEKRDAAKKAEKQPLLICPYPGNGDLYLIGRYLPAYLRKNGIEEYILTVVGQGNKKLGEMFLWKDVEVLSQEESDALVAYVRFMGQELDAKILNDCYQQTVNRRFRGYKGLDFATMFRKVVFGLEDDVLDLGQESIPEEKEIEKYAGEIGMQKGKTVILSPYANTIAKLPDEFWKELADRYHDKGYTVYTNTSDVQEVIPGTKCLFAPFAYMKSLVQYAGTFIGLRSGLCDIVAGAEAKKIILYPEGMLFGACTTLDYFSIVGMGLCNDAVEIEFGAGQEKEILEGILTLTSVRMNECG